MVAPALIGRLASDGHAMFHRILAAVDGSPPSLSALALAAQVARHQAAELTALTVVPLGGAWSMPASARLPAGVSASTLWDWGPTGPTILREAEMGGHDLIVLGSRGRDAVTATVLGSVARSVVSRSHIPVLVAKGLEGAGTTEGIARILVALDGSPESGHVLAMAADLARSEGARLTLMTAGDHADASQDVLDIAVAALPPGFAVDTRVARGQVDAAILQEVDQGGHDLLVLGSRGRGLGRGTLLGSTGLSMLRHCPAPVLIARPPERPAGCPDPRRPAIAV